jgi:hypothetical protein
MLALLLAVHVSISAGAGASEDFLGVQLQVREGHLALFAASGPLALGGLFSPGYGPTYSAAFGARWYLRDGDGFFLSGQYAFFKEQTCYGACSDPEFPPTWSVTSVATLDAGWRFRWDHLFADAALGGGALWYNDGGGAHGPAPDFTLALGWEF